MQKPDALIFDMDGTLWDAVETYALSWNEFFKTNAIKAYLTKADLDAYMGLEQDAYLEAVLPQFTADKRTEIYKHVIQLQYALIDKVGGILYEGVLDGIKELSKTYKLFIVSNCPELTIKHFMKWAGIENFITDTLAHGQNFKPKNENISYLIKKHALKNPVYIGDTNSDSVESAIANIPFIFMEYGLGNTTSYHKKFASFIEFSQYYKTLY